MKPVEFAISGIGFRYPRASCDALSEVTASVLRGEVLAIIGPNGSGKSTLLRVMLGLLQPQRGTVLYRGKDVRTWGRRALARHIAVVHQESSAHFSIPVRELVAMGRYPHLGLWRPERELDRQAIERALSLCDVRQFMERDVRSLSSGERQRVRIAHALAQEPAVLLLDEPTASLDLRYEMATFELMRDLATTEGVTLVIVTHHVNLAARYADRLLLLKAGQPVVQGSPGTVLSPEVLKSTYHWPISLAPHPGPGWDQGAPQIVPLAKHEEEQG